MTRRGNEETSNKELFPGDEVKIIMPPFPEASYFIVRLRIKMEDHQRVQPYHLLWEQMKPVQMPMKPCHHCRFCHPVTVCHELLKKEMIPVFHHYAGMNGPRESLQQTPVFLS